MVTENKELFIEEETPSNEMKGFTKAFQRRSKEKRAEDQRVVELLTLRRENKLTLGAKVTEKAFKNKGVKKVFVASNCDIMTLRKIKHYASLSNTDIVELDLDNQELGEKIRKAISSFNGFCGELIKWEEKQTVYSQQEN